MKVATTAARNLIQNSVTVQALPKLVAEWEHNRFSDTDTLTVTPAQAQDVEWLGIYDLQSIIKPARPTTGVAKARFNNGTIPLQTGYRDTPKSARHYISTDEDEYKYWSSTQKASSSVSGGAYSFSTPIVLELKYDDPVSANKLVIGFETSYNKPVAFTIQVSYNGTTWVTAATNPTINADGQVILWRNTSNQWVTTANYTGTTTIVGLRVTVNSMNGPNSHLDVIQMGLRLEHDLSDVVESYNRDFEISDRDHISPLGVASSNVASVDLSNVDGRFNNDNVDSPYHGLIGRFVRMTMELSVDARSTGGSADERFREFTMWTDVWAGQDEASSSVSLTDSSVFLQEANIPNVFWEKCTVGALIWQTMDILGMTNYNYTRSVLDTSQGVPYFWPDEENTAWDQLSDLSRGTQTAIYFDEYDVLQIKTRRAIFGENETVDWALDAVQNGVKLADIEESVREQDTRVNRVEVNYSPAKYSSDNNGLPKMEVVWEPEDQTVTLRATPLVKDLPSSEIRLWIRAADAAFWPYSSLVNIRGEILRYDGKEYNYYLATGTLAAKNIKSLEEKETLDGLNPALAWKNAFTGKLVVTERSLFGSGTANHTVVPAAYSGAILRHDGSAPTPISASAYWTQKDGYVQLTNIPTATRIHKHLRRHGTAVITPVVWYGTRIRFPRGGVQAAGLWFDGNSIDLGYSLEIQTTENAEAIEKRAAKHEVSLSSVVANAGPNSRIKEAGGDIKGTQVNIDPGRFYSVDVCHIKARSGVNEEVRAYIDGVFVGRWIVPSNQRPPTDEGRFGMFVRAASQVDFEYMYATENTGPEQADVSSFLDLRSGGFTSGYIERDWKYNTRFFNARFRGQAYPQMISRSNFAFDEFGPVVHELREFDIKFDEDSVPVQHSSLYFSNTSQVACTSYYADPFGAKFMLANTGRNNAIVQGEDTLMFGIDNAVTQKIFVYGRALYQQEDLTLTKEDKNSIRRNGLVTLTFDSRFIQTKAAAESLGQWVVDLWATSADELNMAIFGNPILQIGDVVTVNYPAKGLYPGTHKYFVVALSNSYSNGLETHLFLRRAKI